MRGRGFMPFTAAGVLIVLLVLGLVSQAALSRHHWSLSIAEDISGSGLAISAALVRGDLASALRYAVYGALWEVGARASEYSSDERVAAVKQLAKKYFSERVVELGRFQSLYDWRLELDIPSRCTWPELTVEGTDGGYVLARAGFPEGTLLRLRSRDGSLSLTLPLGEVESFVDSRYFLLQERMDEFVRGRGSILVKWGLMEYLMAWGQAWLTGWVHLSASRTRAFFETAWAMHEFEVFGSSDYWAAARGLFDAVGGDVGEFLGGLEEHGALATPVRTADVAAMRGYIERALRFVAGAASSLSEVRGCLELARENAARFFRESENRGEVMENIRRLLGEALENILIAWEEISSVEGEFTRLLDFISGSKDSSVMGALHRGITSRGLAADYPSLKEQVEWGVRGALAKLSGLERAVRSASAMLDGGTISGMDGYLEEILESVNGLLSDPVPLRWATFTAFGCGDPQREVGNRAAVYIESEDGGTLGVLRVVFEEVGRCLDEMWNFSQRGEPAPAQLRELKLDEKLSARLLGSFPELGVDREELYRMCPPPPINLVPGLSVFHDVRVKSISLQRQDPAGRLGFSQATPLPLWFLGVVLWWGQWEISVELERAAVEEILDFSNPVLPRPCGPWYTHQPLAYRWELPENTYKITVVLISLSPFGIGVDA